MAKKIVVELQRTIHGWGTAFEQIEVELTEEVQALLDNELAKRIKKSEVTDDGGPIDADPDRVPTIEDQPKAEATATTVGQAATPTGQPVPTPFVPPAKTAGK